MSLIQENNETFKQTSQEKYKEYRIKWIQQNKEKINLYAVQQYKKRVNKDPAYREYLNEKSKQRYHLKEKTTNGEPIKRGRPKIIIDDSQPIIKKTIGRPKKY